MDFSIVLICKLSEWQAQTTRQDKRKIEVETFLLVINVFCLEVKIEILRNSLLEDNEEIRKRFWDVNNLKFWLKEEEVPLTFSA